MASMGVGISMVMHMTTTTGINWNLTPILVTLILTPILLIGI